ncbi:MAG: protein translocase subunit SecD [Candidatus Sumerlaeaceae bacterium]|nr:protein translocase subunit SecD [Candidatus Sumerlaeaceae bacterium]
MKPDVKWRLAVVLGVTAICLYLIFPTLTYFASVSDLSKATPEEVAKLDELRKQSVPLGLDLQGGVDVLLGIDEAKTRATKLETLAEELRKAFKQESPSIDATVEVTTTTDQIAITVNKPEQLRSADNILTTRKRQFANYRSEDLKAGAALTIEPDKQLLSQDVTETVDSALKVIRERVDKLGVTQPSVAKQGTSRIRVQIPGEKNPDAVVKTVIKPAKLEFRGVKTTDQPRERPGDGKPVYSEDSASYIDIKTGKVLEGKRIPPGYEVRVMKDGKVDRVTGQKTPDRYVLVRSKIEMDGSMLGDSWMTVNPAAFEAPIQVHLEFKPDGAKKFEEITTQYKDRPLAILLDNVVYSAPNVDSVISGGHCFIHGSFTQEEGRELSLVLKAGALPADMEVMEKRSVEATLGADSIRSSVHALALGSAIVGVYIIGYYGMAGFIAVLAVIINTLIILAFMKLANATLTLSGIGGILLTVGMAVDANVLIYERIREELRNGKSLKSAISLGFNRAFGVIFDANLTTLISGLVLLQFGAGSVKGFALALNVGMIANLFTGLFVTHALIDFWFGVSQKFNVGKLQWFKPGVMINFINMRRFSYVFSLVLFTACLLWILPFKPFPGSNWGVDFTGGLLSTVKVTEAVDTQKVQGNYTDWRVQKVAGKEQFLIRTKFADSSKDQITKTQQEVVSRLEKNLGAGKFEVIGSDAVGNEVGQEFTFYAVLATVIASLGIMVYMWFRFEFLYGFAAVVALFHDLIITYGIFNMLGHFHHAGEVTLDVVSALLVILGYSVNDTIIIFDRVRENVKLHPALPFKELVNRSICESLNRTVMTVSTVVIVLVTMLVVGGAGLYDFALVLLIGIIKGTYSSSFVAAPILFDLHERERRKAAAGTGGSKKVIQPLMKEREG